MINLREWEFNVAVGFSDKNNFLLISCKYIFPVLPDHGFAFTSVHPTLMNCAPDLSIATVIKLHNAECPNR
jgi:hypothetical protein